MTEAEWLACTDTWPLLDFLTERASDRKLRLFGVACCQRAEHFISNPRTAHAIAVAECYADGLASNRQRLEAQRCCRPTAEDIAQGVRAVTSAMLLLQKRAATGVRLATVCAARDVTEGGAAEGASGGIDPAWSAERAMQVRLLSDIFGNPFRSVAFAPEWRTDTAVSLASLMYESRDFSAMPILADALQDAGCGDEQVLQHCRDPHGVHVRGCWVVDLVLGKD